MLGDSLVVAVERSHNDQGHIDDYDLSNVEFPFAHQDIDRYMD